MYKATLIFQLLILGTSLATEQVPEVLIFQKKRHRLYSNPLYAYFKQNEYRRHTLFDYSCSANGRGYLGTWEISQDTLFLKKLQKANCSGGGKNIPLYKIFKKRKETYPAVWFTGKLIIPLSKEYAYPPYSRSKLYKETVAITIENGVVNTIDTIDNSRKVELFRRLALLEDDAYQGCPQMLNNLFNDSLKGEVQPQAVMDYFRVDCRGIGYENWEANEKRINPLLWDVIEHHTTLFLDEFSTFRRQDFRRIVEHLKMPLDGRTVDFEKILATVEKYNPQEEYSKLLPELFKSLKMESSTQPSPSNQDNPQEEATQAED